MIRRLGILSLASALAALAPASAFAQDVPLSKLLVDLIQSDIRLQPPEVAGFTSHEAHFLPGANQQLAPYLFNQQLVLQLATFPIGSSSGGFSFDFDAASGTFKRASNSFGPAFAERALTNGKKRVTFGTTFQYSSYSSFEGKSLDDGSIKFYLTHLDVPGNNFFEGDLVQAGLRLDMTSATTTLFANYGLTNNFDIAIAAPIIHVKMDAATDAEVLRLATGQSAANIHAFPGNTDKATFTSSGSATGIGDILLRAKYHFLQTQGGGLAADIDIRLPTGDAENLLGTGAAAATFTLIGSQPYGRLAPHFNVGFTGAGTSDVITVPNEFAYKFGTEWAAAPTATFNFDFVGRTMINSGRLELVPTTHSYFNSAGTPGTFNTQEYQLNDGSLNLLTLAIGGKFNVGGNFLINANVLFPLTDAGVKANVTPVIGAEYTF
jgi:hypothetical protein